MPQIAGEIRVTKSIRSVKGVAGDDCVILTKKYKCVLKFVSLIKFQYTAQTVSLIISSYALGCETIKVKNKDKINLN